MKQSKKFSEIIERIEYLRNLLKLNKSRFSADIGMKPQTYNNFIGAQASKPNVELLLGIVNMYGANPMWILNGTGPVFLDEQKRNEYLSASPRYQGRGPGALAGVHEEGAILYQPSNSEQIESLKGEIKNIEPLLSKVDSQIRQVEIKHLPVVDRYIALLKRYYEVDPLSAIEEFRELLQRIELRIGKRKEESGKNKSQQKNGS